MRVSPARRDGFRAALRSVRSFEHKRSRSVGPLLLPRTRLAPASEGRGASELCSLMSSRREDCHPQPRMPVPARPGQPVQPGPHEGHREDAERSPLLLPRRTSSSPLATGETSPPSRGASGPTARRPAPRPPPPLARAHGWEDRGRSALSPSWGRTAKRVVRRQAAPRKRWGFPRRRSAEVDQAWSAMLARLRPDSA